MKPNPHDWVALVLALGASGSILILVITVAIADGIVAPWLETLISAALGTFVGSVAAYLGGGRNGEHRRRRLADDTAPPTPPPPPSHAEGSAHAQ